MLIANPVYDTVFKYFLDDNALAKQFIGLLLDVTILELEIQPQEVPLKIVNPEEEEKPISIIRLDFKATIRDEKGNRKVVLIELQKLKNAADLFRFRNYLGSQYINKENSYIENEERIPVPIIAIYFLGFNLPFYPDIPLIKVERNYLDICTKEILSDKIPFIETLSHDMILVQLPALKKRRRFEIEKILSIFDSKAGIYLEIDEKEYPEACKGFLDRLHRVMKQPEVVRDLVYEEMLNQEVRQNYGKYLQLKEDIKIMEIKFLEEKKLKEKAKIREKEVIAIAKQGQKIAIINLKNKGMSTSEIASIFNFSEEEIKGLLA